MSQKQANTDIRCRVTSCAFHCENKDYCSLGSIQVDPCPCAHCGTPADESCCGSYKQK